MIIEFRHLFKNHLKCFEFVITAITISLVVLVYLKLKADLLVDAYFYVFVSVSLLPVIYLYFEYRFFNDSKTVFKIDYVKSEITYSSRGNSSVNHFEDIDKIVVHRTPSWTRADRVQMLPFEHFHYARIHTKKGLITVTCLLSPNVSEVVENIPHVKIEERRRLFTSILLE